MGKPLPKIIVVDTNVLIRATFQKPSPVSRRIYQAIKEQTCILALSPAILTEIREVISRDYIIALTHKYLCEIIFTHFGDEGGNCSANTCLPEEKI
jgi:predicted nucleic acid-binding protein